MKVLRSFSATSSAGSLLLGFLDVISCGFAAALVLGLILSIVQPHATSSAAPLKQFRYFEFLITDAKAAPGGRPYLSPEILIRRRSEKTWARLPLSTKSGEWSVPDAPCTINFFGLGPDERLEDIKRTPGGAERKVFSILVTGIPSDVEMDTRVIYSGRTDLAHFTGIGESVPDITVDVLTSPGSAAPESHTLKFGGKTPPTIQ